MKKIMNMIITVLLCFGMITINILPISAFNQSGVIVEKEIYLNLPVDDILQPRASVANDRWKVGEYKDTVRGLTMTANVTLRVTIMVNESTGIITSYRGLAVNTNWVDVGGYTGRLADISTTATYSSNRRSLNCTGRFKIYAVSTVGSDPHYSKEFSITLKATI